MSHYFNKQGKAISERKFFTLLKDESYRRINLTLLPGGRSVSTIWLGINHQFGSGAPIIFETLYQGDTVGEETKRYSTLEEAIAGHQAMVNRHNELKTLPPKEIES